MITSIDGRLSVMSAIMLIFAVSFSISFGEAVYQNKTSHPRLFIKDVQELAQRNDGPFAEDYKVVIQQTDDTVRRGDRGQEAWGHPFEPTAQYNHITEGRAKTPVCPCRIDVGDPEGGSRTLFLYMFEVADEDVRQPTTVEFAAPAGVNIAQQWHVRFNPKGTLGSIVNGKSLTTTIKTET